MKLARRFLIVLVAVALVLALMTAGFYAAENWRDKRAWDETRRDLLARGERLDWAAFIPPPVPDDQNLAMSPLFVRAYQYRVDPATGLLTFPFFLPKDGLLDEIGGMPAGVPPLDPTAPNEKGDWAAGRPLDLAKWQRYYARRADFPHPLHPQSAAEDVLLALTRYGPLLDELAQAAAERPQTRFPVNWTQRPIWAIAMPHLVALQHFADTLRLRAVAELTLGRTGDAARDIALLRRLCEAATVDPVMIALLVDRTQTNAMLQVIWEGLAARRWSAPELDGIQKSLRDVDFLADFKRASRAERATFIQIADTLKVRGNIGPLLRIIQGMQSGDKPAESLDIYWRALDCLPVGCLDQNKAIGSEFFQTNVIETVDAHRVWLSRIRASHALVAHRRMTPDTWLMWVAMPVYESVQIKCAGGQAGVDQAIVACGLEKYYLVHHAYPVGLKELVPAFLDRVSADVMNGAPPRYRRTDDGRYLLYSIGWDGRDDGGQVAWRTGSRLDEGSGDWVWQYTQLHPPPPSSQRSK